MAIAQAPGWSWVGIYSPWRDDSWLGHGQDVFATKQAAVEDLRRMVPRAGLPGELDGLHAQLDALLRADTSPEWLVLYCNNDEGRMWAWLVYPVDAGKDSYEVGTSFFALWKAGVTCDPRFFDRLTTMTGAVINPQREEAHSGGGASGCALALVAIVGGVSALTAVTRMFDLWPWVTS